MIISAEQLCQFLATSEATMEQLRSLSKYSIAPGIKKRKRSETPPEQIASEDEAIYVEQEQRTVKRLAANDPDYENISMKSTLSD